MSPTTVPYSTEEILKVAELIRSKEGAGLLQKAFSENEEKTYAQMGLTDDEFTLLWKVGLTNEAQGGGCPRFRLQRERADVLISRDFPRREHDVLEPEPNRPAERVFPWSDEAEQIHDYVMRSYENEDVAPARILNMCCGSGAIAMSLSRAFAEQGQDIVRVLGIDIEPRIIQRSEFNRLLNQYDSHPVANLIQFSQGDLFKCEAIRPREQFQLIVASPPYSLHPEQHTASGFQGGGPTGLNVVIPLLQKCGDYLAPGGRLICQCYAIGDREEPTMVHDEVARALKIPLEEARRAVIKLEGLKVWRFRDVKCFDTPMPLEYMVSRCADPTYSFIKEFKADPEKRMKEHVDWIETLKKGTDTFGKAYSHLHYVMIDYKKPKGSPRKSR